MLPIPVVYILAAILIAYLTQQFVTQELLRILGFVGAGVLFVYGILGLI